MKKYLLVIIAILLSFSCFAQESDVIKSTREDFVNLLDIKHIPELVKERKLTVFADMGSWIGYALPDKQAKSLSGAFIGPFIMTGNGWVSKSLAEPKLIVNEKDFDFGREIQTSEYLPGKLIQEYSNPEISVTTELCFQSPWTSVVKTMIRNNTESDITISFSWLGSVFDDKSKFIQNGSTVIVSNFFKEQVLSTNYISSKTISIKKGLITATELVGHSLAAGSSYVSYYTQSFGFSQADLDSEMKISSSMEIDTTFEDNKERWDNYILDLFSHSNSELASIDKYKRVAVKAMMTLVANWRAPAGDLLHDASYPSYNGFYGFWSWDSWKHVSANTLYNPDQAKNEVRALFDYQAENGMIPDFVSINKDKINWRDTKPPLSAWAVMNIYNTTNDIEYIKEMFPKIYKYHRWWYQERDHDKNGICEYGSTDGSLIAACWESGMDNGVRFDGAVMLNNGKETAWSMNQENICLNSFLYAEKGFLAKMAEILGKEDIVNQLKQEAEILKSHIQTSMYDEETGFFYDTRIETGEFIKVMGAECWLPLWAGVATPEQAASVMEKMMDPTKFNSKIPLGTLDISHPKLRPERGYWRGPVWIDQVYFGVMGLRKYGYNKEADYIVRKYIDNAQGLLTDDPIHENYNPITGETLNCPNFGWSSATTIMMLLDK